ncbi:hypothetical protein VTO73DRAFT_10376 [Trametes versicolor]
MRNATGAAIELSAHVELEAQRYPTAQDGSEGHVASASAHASCADPARLAVPYATDNSRSCAPAEFGFHRMTRSKVLPMQRLFVLCTAVTAVAVAQVRTVEAVGEQIKTMVEDGTARGACITRTTPPSRR